MKADRIVRFGYINLASLMLVACSPKENENSTVEVANRKTSVLDQTSRRRELTTLRRGNEIVGRTVEHRRPDGTRSVTRSFMVAGKMVMMEKDETGDGLFETLVVLNPREKALEVFERRENGTVVSAPDHLREAYRKLFTVNEDFWSRALGNGTNAPPADVLQDGKEELGRSEQEFRRSKEGIKP